MQPRPRTLAVEGRWRDHIHSAARLPSWPWSLPVKLSFYSFCCIITEPSEQRKFAYISERVRIISKIYAETMTNVFRPRTIVLFLGDLSFFTFALWLSLYARTFELPAREVFVAHLVPFCVLFVIWVGVFFIAGLYESRSIILARRAFSATLLISQIFNICLAALFFFFVPIFGIAPKTLLFIYLIVSFVLVLLWRVWLYPWLGLQKPEPALMVGAGPEIEALTEALNKAHRAPARVVAVVPPSGAVAHAVEAAIHLHRPRFVIADFSNDSVSAAFPELYNYLARGIRFFDALPLYEEVFGRIALSHIDDRWLARNISRSAHMLYDPVKRGMDIVLALPAGLLSLTLYPFIALAIKLQDGGPIFISQERVGQDGTIIHLPKFRSMTRNEQNLLAGGNNKVTPVGKVLRLTRLDELPQLWSIVKGDLSLIGPRPELPSGVALYKKEIPYFDVRHLVRPGLSGWAQLYAKHAHHGVGLEETRDKFSCDLYYLKHRSLFLDLIIALKTIKKLLTRSGI